MSVQWQTLSFPIRGGVDAKSDDRLIPPGKLSRLENGIFTKRGAIAKRNGYNRVKTETSGTSFTPIALGVRNDELFCLTDEDLYTYSSNLDDWFLRSSNYGCDVVSLTQTPVNRVNADQNKAECCSSNGVTLYAWKDSRGGVRYQIDDSTGATLVADAEAHATAIKPRCLTLGNNLILIYAVAGSPGSLFTKVWNSFDPVGSDADSATEIVSDIQSTRYDTTIIGSNGVIAWYTSANDITISYLTSGGALGGPSTGYPTAVTVASNPDVDLALASNNAAGLISLVFADAATGVVGYFLDQSFSTVNGPTTIDTDMTDTVGNLTVGILPDSVSTGVYRAYTFSERIGASEYLDYIRIHTYDSDGTTAADTHRTHASLGSKAFAYGSSVYVNMLHVSALQSTYFLVNHLGGIVSKSDIGIATDSVTTSHLPAVYVTGDLAEFCGVFRDRLDADVEVSTTTDDNVVFAGKHIRRMTYDFGVTPRFHQIGNSTFISGGTLWEYDGRSAVEAGFHLYPENITTAPSVSTGGLTSAVDYSYRVYYEWTNAQGERQQSAWASIYTVTMGASDNTVTLTIPTLSFTHKQNNRTDVNIAVYRTENTPGPDALFYRVSDPDPTNNTGSNRYVDNDPSSDTVTFVDELADASILANELDYQNAGELDNLAAPESRICAGGKERLFFASQFDPQLVRYSKLKQDGQMLHFNDALTLRVDPEGGPITALAILNELLIIFKERSIYAVSGDGVNNFGFGQFSQSQRITSDVGCTNQSSIREIPLGLMFESDRGIYLLSQSLQVEYIGADVEAFNSETIVSVSREPASNRIIFLTTGTSLAYDYFFNQWSTYTNHAGLSSVEWDGQYTYLRANGDVYVQDESYTDHSQPYRLFLETPWMRIRGFQHMQRVRKAHILGEFQSEHQLRLQPLYDYETGPQHPVLTWVPQDILRMDLYGDAALYGDEEVYGGAGSSVYQFRAHMPRQKCEALRLQIWDVPGTDPGASFILSDLQLEIGFRAMPMKLEAGKSVG